jgi:hypothetical protein
MNGSQNAQVMSIIYDFRSSSPFVQVHFSFIQTPSPPLYSIPLLGLPALCMNSFTCRTTCVFPALAGFYTLVVLVVLVVVAPCPLAGG